MRRSVRYGLYAAVLAGVVPRDPSPGEFGRRIKILRLSRGLTLKDGQRMALHALVDFEVENVRDLKVDAIE